MANQTEVPIKTLLNLRAWRETPVSFVDRMDDLIAYLEIAPKEDLNDHFADIATVTLEYNLFKAHRWQMSKELLLAFDKWRGSC